MGEGRIDARIIEACRQGDRGAFRRLFEAHKDRVHSIALHFMGGDVAAARDITQEVFIVLFDRIGQYRGEAEFTTWLHRIVVRACLDERRRGRRLRSLEEAPEAGANLGSGTPESDLAQAETERAVQGAVAGLRPRIRLAILLKYFQGLSYEEMARALGCSKGTVASRLNAGHRILARRLRSLRGPRPREETSR